MGPVVANMQPLILLVLKISKENVGITSAVQSKKDQTVIEKLDKKDGRALKRAFFSLNQFAKLPTNVGHNLLFDTPENIGGVRVIRLWVTAQKGFFRKNSLEL